MKKEFHFQKGEVLLFNKPLHWTSFQLVNKVRWLIKRKLELKKIKVGHAGTLDPLATGLMIVCTGKKTKEINQYQLGDKEYFATIKLGATTPSYDGEKEENYFYSTKHIQEDLIKKACQTFIGKTLQYPPVFSAIKVRGKKMYENARKGKELDVKPRMVHIKEIEIQQIQMPFIELRIHCSKGTYIRSLAHDIGREMGSGAWLTKLRRTKIGDNHLNQAIELKKFEELIKSI